MTGSLPVACISFFGTDGIAENGSFGKEYDCKSLTIWFDSRNIDHPRSVDKTAFVFIRPFPTPFGKKQQCR